MLKKSEDAFANAGQGLMAVAAANLQSAERRDAEQRAAENRKAEMALQAFYNKQAMGDQQAFMRQMAEDDRLARGFENDMSLNYHSYEREADRQAQRDMQKAAEERDIARAKLASRQSLEEKLQKAGVKYNPKMTDDELKEAFPGLMAKAGVDSSKGWVDLIAGTESKIKDDFKKLSDFQSSDGGSSDKALEKFKLSKEMMTLQSTNPSLYRRIIDKKITPAEAASELWSGGLWQSGDDKSLGNTFLSAWTSTLDAAAGNKSTDSSAILFGIQEKMKSLAGQEAAFNSHLLELNPTAWEEVNKYRSEKLRPVVVEEKKPPGLVTPPPPAAAIGGAGAGVVTPPFRPSVPPSAEPTLLQSVTGVDAAPISSALGTAFGAVPNIVRGLGEGVGSVLAQGYSAVKDPISVSRSYGPAFDRISKMLEPSANSGMGVIPLSGDAALRVQGISPVTPQVVQPVQAQPSGPGFFERLRRGVVEPAARRIMQPMAQEEVPTTTQSPTPMSHLDIAAQTGHLKNVFGVDDATAQKMVEIYAADRQAPVEQVYGEVAQILQKAQLGDQAALQTVSTYKERARRGY